MKSSTLDDPGTDTEMQMLYVRLLDEGTEVFRPTVAEPLPNGCFKLLTAAGYDPEKEHWEFPPGSVVHVAERNLDGGKVLIAVKLV